MSQNLFLNCELIRREVKQIRRKKNQIFSDDENLPTSRIILPKSRTIFQPCGFIKLHTCTYLIKQNNRELASCEHAINTFSCASPNIDNIFFFWYEYNARGLDQNYVIKRKYFWMWIFFFLSILRITETLWLWQLFIHIQQQMLLGLCLYCLYDMYHYCYVLFYLYHHAIQINQLFKLTKEMYIILQITCKVRKLVLI